MNENNVNSESSGAPAEGKSGGNFLMILIVVSVIALIIIGVVAGLYLKKKSAGEKQLDSERQLIKVNWKAK